MIKTTSEESCALCGLPVEIKGFTLSTSNGEKKFCCAGCLSIYQLLNNNTSNTTLIETSPDNEDKHQ